jgi:autotransporter-associated beta strand protein
VISAGTINIGANTTMSFDFANHRGQAVFGDGASYRTAEAAYPMLTLTAPTVNVTGPVQVNLTTLIPQSGVLAAGRYHLVAGGNFTGGKLAGSGGGSITTQIRIAGELASSNSRTVGKLTVEAPSLWGTGGYDLVTQEIERLALVWTGANGSDWNISSQNWRTWDNYGTEEQFTAPQAGVGQQFLPGDVVLLDSANFSVPTTVNILSGGAAPSEVFVRNGNYSEDPTVAASMRADLNAGGTFTLNSAAGGLGLTGDARLTKLGTGTLVLNGTHTYKGETEVRGGYLRVDGDSRQATGNLTVYAGAVLSGRGIIGGAVSIQRGGYLSPSGSTPYNLASNPAKPAWRIGTTFETTTPGVATAPVTLHFANNVVLESGSTLVIRVQGSNATGYSALDKLNFTNATNNNFVAKPGTKIFVDLDITDINQLSNPFFRVSVITGASISDSTTRNVQIYSLNFPGTKYGLDTQGYLYTIPEPSTYGLLGGVSLLGLALFRRHRAKRKAVNRAVSEN